ncbi:MAG: tRNA 4-thiouridine(8) synthase ThiI [Syntrophales bacterium]
MMNRKAIALLSGGLDSTLAVKLMIDQGIDMTAIHFTSIFCNCTPKTAGCKMQARKVAEEFDVPIRVIHKGMDYIKMVERPPHGHGSGMNPCIDCRIYMLRKVREMMPELDASFVITGEVLGQRPMSQQRHTIRLIERESGLADLILRPLSALHFEPTRPEREGIVDREKLLDMSGRTRKPQFALAAELGVKDYPCPAGGCLLTDKVIAARLRDLFTHQPDYTHTDLVLITTGRHLRLRPGLKVIMGRIQEENERVTGLASPEQFLFSPHNFRGPTALAIGMLNDNDRRMIGEIIAAFSQDHEQVYTVRQRSRKEGFPMLAVTEKKPREGYELLRIG